MISYTKEILDLKKNGFTNFSSFFDKNEINEIANEVNKIIIDETDSFSKRTQTNEQPLDERKTTLERPYHHSSYKRTNTFHSSILGKSKKVDNFFKKLFSDPKFNFLCEKFIGKNYRIYTLAIRQLDNLSKPIGLHQDNWGQLTFSIPLNDILEKDGTTTIISGSHLFDYQILDEFFNVPDFLYNFFTFHLKGKIGDLSIFLNKTFHGNYVQKKNKKKSTSIHIALVAEGGYSYLPFIPIQKTNYGDDLKNAVGDTIYEKMFSKENLIISENRYFTYLKNENLKAETKIFVKSAVGREIRALTEVMTKEKKHLIDEIFINKNFSFLHLPQYIHFKMLIYLKKIYKKIKNLF
jgi:putative 2OG-Fe(II) oxygenase